MDAEGIEAQRQMRVVKSNELIRRGRFNLSLVEQRIVLFMISKIKPTDTTINSISFNIREFCEVCGIEYRQNLTQLKQVIQTLADKSMWLKLPGNKHTLIRWIQKPTIEEGNSIIEMELDRDLVPYLIKLANNFTEYQLISVLALKSKYSVKLYELLKSYAFLEKYKIPLEDLRDYLQVSEKYKETKYFKKYILDPAVEEISHVTDIEVSYIPIRTGRFITAYEFSIAEQETDDFVIARATLAGKVPSRAKRQKDFQEFIKNYDVKNQMSLFEDDE